MKNNLNLIIAAVLMMGFLLFWDSFVTSRYNAVPAKTPAGAVAAPIEHGKMTPAELTEAAQMPNPAAETLTLLENADTKVSILSKGARVASWQIRERDRWIELVQPEKTRTVSPLETFADINFAAVKQSNEEAVFTATLPNGVVVKKSLRLAAGSGFNALSLSFTNTGAADATLEGGMPLGNGMAKHEVGTPYNEKRADEAFAETRVLGLAERVKSWKPGVIFGRSFDKTDSDQFKWVAVDNNHFLMALIPPAGQTISGIHVSGDRKHTAVLTVPFPSTLKPGETIERTYKLYAGPKGYADLKKIGQDLDLAVDFGFFGPIAKMLLRALIFFHSLTGNYGWAIIILTFCIQMLVFPLTRKNLQHSMKMKQLQPYLKKLQEQYKSDPKRLQVETFNFYKKNGMKFMGMEGCFPMMLQIPVFLAFYATLRVAYELRGAPWIFWIHDLGAHDPRYVLPIIMGIGMFLQQKLTAVAADPAQARMMMFMPIMFTFMFMKLPAGLVLYWCMNSLTTISIQTALGVNKPENAPPPLVTN